MTPAASPWRFQPHPEVWLLVAGLAALYALAVRRLGPAANRPGERAVTTAQASWFAAGLLILWLAADWPVHDVAEDHLYSVHMGQHMLLSLVVPPMLLLATPTWLARLVVGSGRSYRVLRAMTRLVPATLLFNAVVVLSHWPVVVNASAGNGLLHYGVHVAVLISGLVVWFPVAGPLPELRFSMPVQMMHLFLQSIVPTVPAGWLTFAEGAVYKHYDSAVRAFSISVVDDQQLAGMLMKVVGGAYLWVVIAALFVRFVTRHADDDRARGMALDRRAPVASPASQSGAGEALTWEQVQAELEAAGPPPREPYDA